MTPANDCLRRSQITEEMNSLGGWQSFQEHGNCGWYLQVKKERNESRFKSKRRNTSSAIVLRSPG